MPFRPFPFEEGRSSQSVLKSGYLARGLCSTLLLTAIGVQAALPIPPFQAHYQIYSMGLPVGTARMELNATGSQGYTAQFTVRPNPLATLFVTYGLDEQVSGRFNQERIQPVRYERQTATGNERHSLRVEFDWSTMQAVVQQTRQPFTAHQSTQLALFPDLVDPLSLNLKVMWDLQRGQLPERYPLLDGTEVRIYDIHPEGEEVLSTALGSLRTVRISQVRLDGLRTTTFWFAVTQHYVPVQITRRKNGQEDLRLEIRAVIFPPSSS